MAQTLIGRFHRLRDSLLANDPSLTCLGTLAIGLEAIPFSFHYLEDEYVHQALVDCFIACCEGNDTIQSVVLQALPEPELCFALPHMSGLVNLRELRIVNNTKSQSLHLTVLTTFLQAHQATLMRFNHKKNKTKMHRDSGLRRIYRAHLLDDTIANYFAGTGLPISPRVWGRSPIARHTLKLIPRCSIQEPNLTLDSMLRACATLPVLQTVRLTAGYDHNAK